MPSSFRPVGESRAFDGTTPGAGTEGDYLPFRTDLQGGLLVNIGHPYFFQTNATFATITASTAGTIAASVASLSIHITDLFLSANTLATMTFYENPAATSPTQILRIYVPANHSFSHTFRQPWKLAAGAAFGVGIAESATTSITVLGYLGP